MFMKFLRKRPVVETLTVTVCSSPHSRQALRFSYHSSTNNYEDTVFRLLSLDKREVFAFRMDDGCSSTIIRPLSIVSFDCIAALRYNAQKEAQLIEVVWGK
jgi:hypothetical protein